MNGNAWHDTPPRPTRAEMVAMLEEIRDAGPPPFEPTVYYVSREGMDTLIEREFRCYHCVQGEHGECTGIAWVPDIPCDCAVARHATGT